MQRVNSKGKTLILEKTEGMRRREPQRIWWLVKNLSANAGTARDMVLFLGWEDLLEEEMATHSSILGCEFPCLSCIASCLMTQEKAESTGGSSLSKLGDAL